MGSGQCHDRKRSRAHSRRTDCYWFDRANGDIVGSVEVSAWVNAPLVAAGDTIIIPAGFPLAPGQKPQLIVLRLPD